MANRKTEEEDRFFENAIDMICFLDFNGYFRRVNAALGANPGLHA